MKYLKVKNWEKFQHYKDRNPPWIKLNRDLLRDYEFTCLQDASKLHLMLIWLLASQMDNKIPADENFIKNQIGVKDKLNLKELINKGYLIDDSGVLAGCKQSAMPETYSKEAYSEETEKEYIDQFEEFWNLYGIKKGRAKCESKYNYHIRNGVKHELIMEGLRAYQNECVKNETTKEFIKNPLTWLNGEHWNDEYEKVLSEEDELLRIQQNYELHKLNQEGMKCKAIS